MLSLGGAAAQGGSADAVDASPIRRSPLYDGDPDWRGVDQTPPKLPEFPQLENRNVFVYSRQRQAPLLPVIHPRPTMRASAVPHASVDGVVGDSVHAQCKAEGGSPGVVYTPRTAGVPVPLLPHRLLTTVGLSDVGLPLTPVMSPLDFVEGVVSVPIPVDAHTGMPLPGWPSAVMAQVQAQRAALLPNTPRRPVRPPGSARRKFDRHMSTCRLFMLFFAVSRLRSLLTYDCVVFDRFDRLAVRATVFAQSPQGRRHRQRLASLQHWRPRTAC